MDVIDRAQDEAGAQLQLQLASRRAPPALPATGRCYHCDEPLPKPLRFCDKLCRDSFEVEQAAFRRNGIRR